MNCAQLSLFIEYNLPAPRHDHAVTVLRCFLIVVKNEIYVVK